MINQIIFFELTNIEKLYQVPVSILSNCITSIFYSIAYQDDSILEMSIDDILEGLSDGKISAYCSDNLRWATHVEGKLWSIIDELYRKIWSIKQERWLNDKSMISICNGEYDIEETIVFVRPFINKIQVVIKLTFQENYGY